MQPLHEPTIISTDDRANAIAQTLVEDYRDYLRYREQHPHQSPYQMSDALDQPRS